MYTCLLDKFLATQSLQGCHIITSMVKLYDFEFEVMVDLSSLWSLGLRIGQLTTSEEWLVSGVHHAAGCLTSRFRNHTIFSNLSSFFTLCIDLRRSVRKTPAFSIAKHFMQQNIDEWSGISMFETKNFCRYDLKVLMQESSPAPMNDPFAITWLPWLLKVTPRFSRVPPKTVYMVAICSIVAFRAALSDW